MGFQKDFIQNVAKFGGFTYGVQFLEFGATIILSRLITPEEYGFVALIAVFSGFIFIFTNVGIKHTIIRNDYNEQTLGRLFSLTLWIGLSLFLIFSLLAYPIALFYENEKLVIPTIIMGITFISQSINFVPNSIATKMLNFNIIGLARIYQTIFQVTLMIILALLGFSYWSLIIPIIISPLVQFFYFSIKLNFPMHFHSLKNGIGMLLQIKSLVGSITTSSLINYWTRNADNLIIGKVFGEEALGLYNRAYRFIYLSMRLITGIFGTVLFPSLKKLKDEGGDINKEFLSTLGVIGIINFPLAMVLVLFADPIVLILWGENWTGVSSFLPYIGILILIQTIFSASTDFYVLQNKEDVVLKLAFITSFFMLFGIIAGSFFSPILVIVFYTLANIILLPIQVYFGFYRSLNFSKSELTKFWMPKFILISFLLYFVYFQHHLYTVVVCVVYLFHLLFYQRKDIGRFYLFLSNRIRK